MLGTVCSRPGFRLVVPVALLCLIAAGCGSVSSTSDAGKDGPGKDAASGDAPAGERADAADASEGGAPDAASPAGDDALANDAGDAPDANDALDASDASGDADTGANDAGEAGSDAKEAGGVTCTSAAQCNDSNPCTVDSCDPVTGCQSTPAALGTSVGLCAACDGAGHVTAAVDDQACGAVTCSGWFTKTGVAAASDGTEQCFAHQPIAALRCEAMNDCKDANTADCATQPLAATAAVSCGLCHFMQGCSGATPGTCAAYPAGTALPGTCGLGVCKRDHACDAAGNDACTPGQPTGTDDDCNGVDENCNGTADENYAAPTCGVGICRRGGTCTNGVAACVPGAPQATDLPDPGFVDANCDGIDGDASDGIFVATAGADGASCGLTKQNPCATISFGIMRAATVSRHNVFVRAGTYPGVVVLLNGINV